jgi:hypothetical protein
MEDSMNNNSKPTWFDKLVPRESFPSERFLSRKKVWLIILGLIVLTALLHKEPSPEELTKMRFENAIRDCRSLREKPLGGMSSADFQDLHDCRMLGF